jgi:hypothetical protein
MQDETPPKTDLDDVAGLLREQLAFCHNATRALYNTFCCEQKREAQDETLKAMTRLVQATASAASALNRVTGTQIHQTITIAHMRGEGAPLENAKTNSGSPA